MSNEIKTESLGRTLIVRFMRPESRNSLSVDVLEGIDSVLNELERTTTRVIFTGVDDVFASGANLREIAEVDASTAAAFAHRGQSLMRRIATLSQTTAAAVNGFCYGGALDLALSCDLRIASPLAEFSHPGVNLGIMTGWGGTQRLPRLIGEARALEMFLTGRAVTAEQAYRIGLVHEIADDSVSAAARYVP